MHLRILPDHPKHGLKKDIFQRLEWLKTRFEAFAHASRHQKKNNFLRLERLKPCFNEFSHASRPPGKKKIFNVWSGWKRVLMHFRMLPDHQKHGLKKDVF